MELYEFKAMQREELTRVREEHQRERDDLENSFKKAKRFMRSRHAGALGISKMEQEKLMVEFSEYKRLERDGMVLKEGATRNPLGLPQHRSDGYWEERSA